MFFAFLILCFFDLKIRSLVLLCGGGDIISSSSEVEHAGSAKKLVLNLQIGM